MKLLAIVLSILLAATAASASAEHLELARQAYDSTGILYKQTQSGGMVMTCTVTAFEKVDRGYLFATAAHCVAKDNETRQEVVISGLPFYISFDAMTAKIFHPAKVLMAGYQHRGDDFAVLFVKTKEKWQTMPLGLAGKLLMGEEVLNVASPRGLGRQLFFGRVSLLSLDRPVMVRSINWKNTLLLQIYAGPGSSGSSVVSLEQEAIVAFIVGSISGNPSTVALHVSRFKAFRNSVDRGTYRYFTLEEEE